MGKRRLFFNRVLTNSGLDNSWISVSGTLLDAYAEFQHLNASELSPAKIFNWFWKTDPILGAIGIMFIFVLWSYFGSIATGNYSQVDKLWPIMPIVYSWYFVLKPLVSDKSVYVDPRMILMAFCVTLWGVRLAYNYGRNGGYGWKHEDYRWLVVRKKIGFVAFQILHATFISVMQNIIILWCITPIYLAYLSRGTPLNKIDFLAASLFLFFWLIETIADQQQWNYHQKKKNRGKSNDIDDFGFIHTGLFRYSRHPNFFGEMALWWSFYLFSLAVTGPSPWNWTGLGALCLTGLFQGSTTLTEQISNSKYPAYKSYQAVTSRIIPWFSGTLKWNKSNAKQA